MIKMVENITSERSMAPGFPWGAINKNSYSLLCASYGVVGPLYSLANNYGFILISKIERDPLPSAERKS